MSLQNEIAHAMLKVGAVELNPTDLFTWASGIKSPIYCDTRLTISDPVIRKQLANGLAQNIKEFFPETEVSSRYSNSWYPARCMGFRYFRITNGLRTFKSKRARSR